MLQMSWMSASAALALAVSGPWLYVQHRNYVPDEIRLPPWMSDIQLPRTARPGDRSLSAGNLLWPVGIAIVEDKPILRWHGVPGAISYEVILQDESTKEVICSPLGGNVSWQVSRPLRRGVTYAWSVMIYTTTGEVPDPYPPNPPVRFHVVDAETAATLQHLPKNTVRRVVAFFEAGVIDSARHQLAILESTDPHRAQLVRERIRPQ